MLLTISKKTELEVLQDVICDSCGKSCKNSTNFEYMTLKNYWGYGSKKDGEMWEAHVCEKCVDEKFQFIKFRKEDYNVIGFDRKVVHACSVIVTE